MKQKNNNEIIIPKRYNRVLKIMKISALLFFLCTFCVLGEDIYSQNNEVTLNLKNVTIKDAISEIEKETGYVFIFNEDVEIRLKGRVTIDVGSKPIDTVLSQLLRGKDLDYNIIAKQITLFVNNKKGNIYVPTSQVALKIEPQQQGNTVKGKIVDERGEPLPGVTVVVKGTSIGTTSDVDGNYVLHMVSKNSVLTFSFVGMRTQEVEVGNQTTINAIMAEETIGLEEIIAVGYGTIRKRDVSTSIASVTSESLKDKPVSSYLQAMAGKLAGVRIFTSNNVPGGGSNVRIRGVNSINASNAPLTVIDGFPISDGYNQTENLFGSINTSDIESIEVLKDASSSAIYGARAANGVILITTKKGKIGKPTISVNISTGFENMINKLDVLNREDYLSFVEDSRSQAYIIEDPGYGSDNPNVSNWSWSDNTALRLDNMMKYSSVAGPMQQPGNLYQRWYTIIPEVYAQPYDTDWQDVGTQTGMVQDIQLSATGGTDNLKYMISGGYFNQEGIMEATGYERYSLRSNIELKINNWLKTGLLLAPSMENTRLPNAPETYFQSLITYIPLLAPYDENGDPSWLGYFPGQPGPWNWMEWNMGAGVNPLVNSLINDKRRTIKSLSTVFGEIKLTKDLTFRSEFHTEYKNWERNRFVPKAYPTAGAYTDRSRGAHETSSRLHWNWQNFLTFTRTFGKHNVNAVLGYSAEEISYMSSFMEKYDFPSDNITTLNQALTILKADDVRTNKSSEAMIGSYARAMYNYVGKYYLTASVRRDGSSKFGFEKKWGVFPSFSAAWRMSDESFFTPLTKYINDLKLRGGYGVIGNSGISNYRALSVLGASPYVEGIGSTVSAGYAFDRVPNPDLGWESNTEYDFGVDMELFNSRISFSMDYFYKHTTNMLFDMPLPRITGFSSYTKNIGSMRNRGLEYELTSRNLTGTFNWTTDLNLSYYRNRVLDTGEDKRPLISNNGYTIEGKPLSGLWGSYFLGPYKDWEDVKTNPINNSTYPTWRQRSSPGTSKLFDVNGDGVIDGSDNTILGNPTPDFIWGMTNTFEYNGFDLVIQINGVQGGDHILTNMESVLVWNSGSTNVSYEYFNNYWRPDRPDAKYPVPNRKRGDTTQSRGTTVFDGSYMNIQNITFGYSLPKSLLRKIDVSNLRIYTSIQNALFLTKYPGYNPDVNQSGNSALSQGTDAGAYPLTRIVSFGLNVSL